MGTPIPLDQIELCWKCPECASTVWAALPQIEDIGIRICSVCDVDMELSEAYWAPDKRRRYTVLMHIKPNIPIHPDERTYISYVRAASVDEAVKIASLEVDHPSNYEPLFVLEGHHDSLVG